MSLKIGHILNYHQPHLHVLTLQIVYFLYDDIQMINI